MSAIVAGNYKQWLGTLRLVRESVFLVERSSKPVEPVRFRAVEDVFNFMEPYALREEVECEWVLLLDARFNPVFVEPVLASQGVLNSTLIHPREIYRIAIAGGAAAIIAVHNHPSGDPTPSAEDINMTNALSAAGEQVGIPLLDHIIIGRDSYYSMAEHKLYRRSGNPGMNA